MNGALLDVVDKRQFPVLPLMKGDKMSTVSVWVLVLFMSVTQSSGSAVVDNIATKKDCEKLGKQLMMSFPVKSGNDEPRFQCLEVQKVVLK